MTQDTHPLMHVFYRVQAAGLQLPNTPGTTRVHVVLQCNGIADEPVVAIFVKQEHAVQYADFLMQTKTSIYKG